MLRLPSLLFCALLLLTVLSLARAADLPSGILAERSDASYGAYDSRFSVSARKYQLLLDEIEHGAYGLQTHFERNDLVGQAENAYLLEDRTKKAFFAISDAFPGEITEYEHEALLFRAMRTLGSLRANEDVLFENMMRALDLALPGPNGLQLPLGGRMTADTRFEPNYRSEKALTSAQKQEAYEKRLREFLAQPGASLDEIKLLDAQSLDALPRYGWVEYVQRTNGQVWMTEGKAGHLLLAEGKPVVSAGQLVFLKSRAGEIEGLVATNASGTYKPDLYMAQALTETLATRYGVPSGRTLVTKGEPFSLQNFKLLLKAQGLAPEAIQARMVSLKTRTEAWQVTRDTLVERLRTLREKRPRQAQTCDEPHATHCRLVP